MQLHPVIGTPSQHVANPLVLLSALPVPIITLDCPLCDFPGKAVFSRRLSWTIESEPSEKFSEFPGGIRTVRSPGYGICGNMDEFQQPANKDQFREHHMSRGWSSLKRRGTEMNHHLNTVLGSIDEEFKSSKRDRGIILKSTLANVQEHGRVPTTR
jgi:hypothetical protein